MTAQSTLIYASADQPLVEKEVWSLLQPLSGSNTDEHRRYLNDLLKLLRTYRSAWISRATGRPGQTVPAKRHLQSTHIPLSHTVHVPCKANKANTESTAHGQAAVRGPSADKTSDSLRIRPWKPKGSSKLQAKSQTEWKTRARVLLSTVPSAKSWWSELARLAGINSFEDCQRYCALCSLKPEPPKISDHDSTPTISNDPFQSLRRTAKAIRGQSDNACMLKAVAAHRQLVLVTTCAVAERLKLLTTDEVDVVVADCISKIQTSTAKSMRQGAIWVFRLISTLSRTGWGDRAMWIPTFGMGSICALVFSNLL